MDNKPFEFSEEHVQLFKRVAALITYILELDAAYQHISNLSVPLVPICKGVAVLPIIGKVERERADMILEVALRESQRLDLDYLVVDLSGVNDIVGEDASHLLEIVKTLKLLGVDTIFTGIRPDLAIKAVNVNAELDNVVYRANLEQALSYIGFCLQKKDTV